MSQQVENMINQVQIGDEYFSKASIVCQLFERPSASSDRLKRVPAMGEYVDEQKNSDLDLNNVVMLGDPLLYKNSVALIQEIKIGTKKEKVLDGEKLHQENVALVIQYIELELYDNDMLVWTGKYKDGWLTVGGEKCHMILPAPNSNWRYAEVCI